MDKVDCAGELASADRRSLFRRCEVFAALGAADLVKGDAEHFAGRDPVAAFGAGSGEVSFGDGFAFHRRILQGEPMSVTVHDCEPDVDVNCDGCKQSIGEGHVYCSECAKRDAVDETEQCSQCRKRFPRIEMFSKILGIMCHGCAFRYEWEMMQPPPPSLAAEAAQLTQ